MVGVAPLTPGKGVEVKRKGWWWNFGKKTPLPIGGKIRGVRAVVKWKVAI